MRTPVSLGVALLPFFAVLSTSAVAARPNIVFILTDDQGYGDLGSTGNPVLKTPALDRLAAESVRLADYHVSPTCAPTRASLMTGRDANRTGVWHTIMGRSMLREDETTLGAVFSAAGWRTGLFGKWHLGDNLPFRPEDRGFDEVVRHAAGGIGQTPDFWDNAYFDDTLVHNGAPRRFTGYCTDVFFDEAMRFMGESADAGRPFLAWIATNTPHSPFHAPEEFWRPYLAEGLSEREALFLGMIANVDENVARLRAWLERRGLADNTILVFTTDNGTATGERIFNAGMRGKKASEYDGGHRVPFFVRWPAGDLAHGREVGRLTAHIDILPTLLELCGLPVPADIPPVDGRSIAALLRDPGAAWPADRTVIIDSQRVIDPEKWKQSSVLSGSWRLVNGRELHDVSTDPGQEHDLAAAHPGKVLALRAAYDTWWAGLEPTFARTTRIVLGHPRENPATLNAHDWRDDRRGQAGTPWEQSMIRRGLEGAGRWEVRIHEAGVHRFALRRWPPEVDAALTDPLPAGRAVPGLTAFRETPGIALPIRRARLAIGGELRETAIAPGAREAVFTLPLEAGDVSIEAVFTLEDGRELGAYYVVVERMPPEG